jgi:[ribosomal protein S18]-alanine N-acetyltransferase
MIATPNVSLAVPDDAPAIARMSRDHIEHGLGWSWTGSRVRGAIADAATNVAVIHDVDLVVAFGIMQYGDVSAHLALLAVAPSQQGNGLGGALLSWLEKCALTAGIETIRVEARSDNPGAMTFYRKQGYRQVETRAGYYRGVIDAIRFEKKLR